MFKSELPSAPRPVEAARPAGAQGARSVECGWHLSSLDLAEGLKVVEADDDEVLSLFGTLQPQ